MKKYATLFLVLITACPFSQAQKLTPEAIKSYPFPCELNASVQGWRIAWPVDEQGRRNVYVAEGPDFKARKVTNYLKDEGQEITSLSLSGDGRWIVFVRGGDHGSNWDEGEMIKGATEENEHVWQPIR
jgi:hypothetical protein